jgi:hypothetical protein
VKRTSWSASLPGPVILSEVATPTRGSRITAKASNPETTFVGVAALD